MTDRESSALELPPEADSAVSVPELSVSELPPVVDRMANKEAFTSELTPEADRAVFPPELLQWSTGQPTGRLPLH